jgi:regulatory protein
MAGRITAIRVQKRNRKRVNVFIEGDFAFGLAMIEAARLSKGQYLSDEEIASLRLADEKERAYELALDFLSYRPRSQAEVARRLRQKGFCEPAVERVLQRLSQAGLLDDQAFARYWIDNREQFKPRGIRALRQELRQKGVPDDVVDELVKDVDETESAYRAVAQRVPGWQHLDPVAFRRKLSGYLQRRGFGYDAIREVWDRVMAEREEKDFSMAEREDTTIWDQET